MAMPRGEISADDISASPAPTCTSATPAISGALPSAIRSGLAIIASGIKDGMLSAQLFLAQQDAQFAHVIGDFLSANQQMSVA